MSKLSQDLTNHLASGATSLATCWILKRSDGVLLGFTDHDTALALKGILCEPASGMTGSELRQSDGFARDDQDIAGILSSEKISEADIAAGRYDGAKVETWLVNWQDLSQSHLLRTGHLGDITRNDQTFQAEIRGLTAAMEQERGRLFQFGCDAELGDGRCQLDVSQPGRQSNGTVLAIQSQTHLQLGLNDPIANGDLSLGKIEILSGKAKNIRADILSHHHDNNRHIIELWVPLHASISIGDQVRVTIGCNKRFATCKNKFANQVNFQGFPHMPGNDFVLSYPLSGQNNNGAPVSN